MEIEAFWMQFWDLFAKKNCFNNLSEDNLAVNKTTFLTFLKSTHIRMVASTFYGHILSYLCLHMIGRNTKNTLLKNTTFLKVQVHFCRIRLGKGQIRSYLLDTLYFSSIFTVVTKIKDKYSKILIITNKYSNHLNTGLVRISNSRKWSG